MVAGVRFTAQQPSVVIRRRPTADAESLSLLEKGDEIVATDVFIEEGIEWVKLAKGSRAKRVGGSRAQVTLDLDEDGFVPTEDPAQGTLLRKHTQVQVVEKKEEGVLTKAEIAEIMEKCSNPGMLLPLESKYWSKSQLEMFVFSDGAIRPQWCSLPDEAQLANTNMNQKQILHAFREASDWILNADALLIGSGAGMGVEAGLGTFRGGQKGVWKGLEAVGLAYEDICQPKWFQEEAHLGWAFWDHCHRAYQATTPHDGYGQVRDWAKLCPLGYFSFTSNIDSHWISSGMSSERLLEVHGAVRWLQCSKPCCPDVWRAPKDHGLAEDETTHRVRGILPTCPKCKAVARPNVQMFGGDSAFSKARRQSQFARYDSWLKQLEERPDKDFLRITCLEVGCGLTVPTVRKELEAVVRKFPGARIIRVNPENPGITSELVEKGVSLPLNAGLVIGEIKKQMPTDESKATFILWGKEGGVEVRAPYGTCIGRLLRLAEMEDGVSAEYTKATKATLAGFHQKPLELRLDSSVPVSSFSQIKHGTTAEMEVTAVLSVSAKFKNKNSNTNLNSRLLQRIEKVSELLDDMNELFKQQTYQDEVKKCTDRRGVMRMARTVHFQVLPKYGIEATEKGTALMASWISCAQTHPPIQVKVDKSMDLSYVKQMIMLPPVDNGLSKAPRREKLSAKSEERQAHKEEKAPPPQPKEKSQAEPPPEPPAVASMQVTLHTLQGEDTKSDTFTLEATNRTTVAELRAKLREALSWDETTGRAVKFMVRHGSSYIGLTEQDLVRKVVYVTGCPGGQLRLPEQVEVTFQEMAPDGDAAPRTCTMTVMTDDTIATLRQKLGEMFGWDAKTQRLARLVIKLNGGSFGTLKEQERVQARKVIFVHGVPLASAASQAKAPAAAAARGGQGAPEDAPRASPPEPPTGRPAPAPTPSGEPTKVRLVRLGTQDDPAPDTMTISARPNATVKSLRAQVATELGLPTASASKLKFIVRTGNQFATMRDADAVRECIYVAGVDKLEPAKPQMIDLLMYLDRKLNFKIPLQVRKGDTILQLKKQIVAGDPTGRSNTQSFGIATYSNGKPIGKPLRNDETIMQSCVLELVKPDETGN